MTTRGLSTNNYGPYKFIVASSAVNGTHTTLAGAIADAIAGDTIFLRNSVTENITLDVSTKSGITITGPTADRNSPVVSVTGKWTLSGAGSISINHINLTTNSDYFLSVGGSAASKVYLNTCYLNCSNNTGINFTTSSSSSAIQVIQCGGNLGTTGIAFWTMSSTGIIQILGCQFGNSGGSSTASSNSAGNHYIKYSEMASPVSTSSPGS